MAAHLLPGIGLVVTGLAADVEVDELRALNLTRDAELCSKSTKKTHCAEGKISASRGSCEHDAWTSVCSDSAGEVLGRGEAGSARGRAGSASCPCVIQSSNAEHEDPARSSHPREVDVRGRHHSVLLDWDAYARR